MLSDPRSELPDSDLIDLATRVNGFVYHGDRLNAVVDTVKALRADPGLAHRLLAGSDGFCEETPDDV